jgi:hypothetical protein
MRWCATRESLKRRRQRRNNNWQLLSDRLWHHVARQVGFYCYDWQPADTSVNLLLRILFSDAQHYSMTYGIAIGEGLGKTFAASHYMRTNSNAYYVGGSDEYNRKSFMTALMNAAGMEAKGSVPELMQQFIEHITEKEEPVLVFDDAHKLKDRVLHLIVLLANNLAGKAGIIIMGGETLRTRIMEGVRLKKVGFDEIYKSIGRRFITLGSLGPKDVELVCRANGIYDDELIHYISDNCSNNLHIAAQLMSQYPEMKMAA